MKQLKYFLLLMFLSVGVLGTTYANNLQLDTDPPNEFITLAEFLQGRTDFLNGEFPIVPADEVKKNLKNEAYHIIDIRNEGWFDYGHIKDAANVKAADLLNYFETQISPADYEKIVLVCYSGQSAAYFAGLLRIAGYDNVYSMKWGMSSWREDFADPWINNTQPSFEDQLETAMNAMPEASEHPQLATGKASGEEILKARLQELFEVPYSEFILKSEAVFETPQEYFTLYFGQPESYTNGHIPGSVLYEANSLRANTSLMTLPTDKKVALYTTTGQEAAYVLAYLNVLGYDAGNIAYGENGFKNKSLKKAGSDAFTTKEINMFPVIE
ncbi:rhodanese-like domain-containing protein [Robertkochia sediminum]|uniref:rhodanese-like domain-containing protein n=1 Tax=Robertkochia sediminum TaxID=2785326 RepID=UPI001933812C|nr:rhodanese-like domain-containing protein [Robertkochia sediminum]MBL7471566.1 rhodanese-like domain-containing protein [Robertkochia sediminum]